VNLNGRLAKVESEVARRHRAQMSDCKGISIEELFDRLNAATDPADQDVWERIDAHCQARSKMPSTAIPGTNAAGEVEYQSHYILDWILGLLDGAFDLPAKLPRALLETFDREYGHVMWRCRECRTGYGNASVVKTCLVCGGETEQHCLWSDNPVWETQAEYEARKAAGCVK
jgi:hypothetical protein